MTEAERIAALSAQVSELADRMGRLEDHNAIRRLQHAYGYYMDKCLYRLVVDLFCDDGEVRFMGTVFRGRAGVQRLYAGRFGQSFTGGRDGPVRGLLLEHLQLQDVIDVAPDRGSARARFRTFMQGGSHDEVGSPSPRLPRQWWEAGVYENEYVREDGVWKIRVLDYNLLWQADYETGWAHGTGAVGAPPALYPEDPNGPDEILAEPPPYWPETRVVDFHYPHPVTGEPWPPSGR